MSTALPPTLPPVGTPAKEWSQDTQELLQSSTATTSAEPTTDASETPAKVPISPPSMSREQSKASIASTVPGMPGGWGRDWPAAKPEDADVLKADAGGVLNTITEKVQAGYASLTTPAPAVDDHPASGPIGTPAHPSQITSPVGGITQTVQSTMGGLLASVRNAVGSKSQTDVDALPPNVAGLLPAPGDVTPTQTTDVPSSPAPHANAGTGGRMINTSPPAADVHPAQGDQNESTKHLAAADLGPSPIDGLAAGETRANTNTAHAGNYAFTDLPTKEGNAVNPHAGEPGVGYLEQAKNTVVNAVPEGTGGYLASAMAAVGLGGAAVAAQESKPRDVVEHKEKEEEVVMPQKKASLGPAGSSQNFLDGPLSSPGVQTSEHGPDHDVQRALAIAEGRQVPEFDDATNNGDAIPEHPSTSGTPPIHTTSNLVEKSAVATSPATTTDAPTTSIPEHPSTSEHPIATTSNTVEKAAVATSPATALPGSHPTETGAKESKVEKVKDTVERKLPGDHGAGNQSTNTSAIPDSHPTDTSAKESKVEKVQETVERGMLGDHGAEKHQPTDTTAVPHSAVTEKPQPIDTAATTSNHPKESTSNTSTSSTSSPSKSHKRGPSLKDKIKGEMKVISGKLSRNEQKVEEGRMLKTGLASPTSPSAGH